MSGLIVDLFAGGGASTGMLHRVESDIADHTGTDLPLFAGGGGA